MHRHRAAQSISCRCPRRTSSVDYSSRWSDDTGVRMGSRLQVLLVGGPMYDPLYSRLSDFEEQEGVTVEVVASLPHPELNDRVEEEFGSGEASYDLISTHVKYAPSQARWLSPLDEDLDEGDLQHFSPLTLELARIDGGPTEYPNVDLNFSPTARDSSPVHPTPGEMRRGHAPASGTIRLSSRQESDSSAPSRAPCQAEDGVREAMVHRRRA